MKLEFNGFSKEYLSMRLGKMLAEKDQRVARYHEKNEEEREAFCALGESLSDEQAELFEAYHNALIDRQINELYYAYMFGLHDGITIKKMVAD